LESGHGVLEEVEEKHWYGSITCIEYNDFVPGAPAGFQARVGKHLFDKIRRKAPKNFFRLPTLPYVTVAHPANRSTLVQT